MSFRLDRTLFLVILGKTLGKKKDSLLSESPEATRQVDATLRDDLLRAGIINQLLFELKDLC